MLDDFKLVKGRRKKKQKLSATQFLLVTNENCVLGKLEKVVEELQQTRFCFELLKSIDYCLSKIDSTTISEILCYGLGNFSESKAALHQLAALLTISKKYNSSVTTYDPVFNLIEINVLKALNFNVPSENEEGKRKISQEKFSLIFFPHCPKQLTNNFLWRNWNTALLNCLLITNSFTKIIQDNTKKVIENSANYIFQIHPKTSEIAIEDCYPYNNIFNDISIHYFRHSDLIETFFSESIGEEPTYLQDTEFITSNINKINIKDE